MEMEMGLEECKAYTVTMDKAGHYSHCGCKAAVSCTNYRDSWQVEMGRMVSLSGQVEHFVCLKCVLIMNQSKEIH